MRFETRAGGCAIEIEQVRWLLFTIRLSFGEVVIGGEEEWGPSSLLALAGVEDAIDPALRPDAAADELMGRLTSDENHDRHLLQLGENFDGWTVRGFTRDDRVVLVVVPWPRSGTGPADAEVFAVDRSEFLEVVEQAKAFYDAHATRPDAGC